jgi:hypothetical protein
MVSMNRDAPNLTIERARAVLRYDPDTGHFWWLVKLGLKCKMNAPAGNAMRNGYRRITIDGAPYQSHRLAIFMTTGEWPPVDVDHINADRADNRLANLRLASRRQNQGNRPGHSKLGNLKGTYQKGSKWVARIAVNYRHVHLGMFHTQEQAHEAYMKAAREHFGDFANPGSVATE